MTLPDITPDLLADIKAKAEAATQGEWTWRRMGEWMLTTARQGALIIISAARSGMHGAKINLRNHKECLLEDFDPEQPDAAHIARMDPPTTLALIAEIQRLHKAIETMCPARDGFGEWFDELIDLGVLVEVPSDAAYREEWGDQDTMYVYAWHPLAARKEADRG